MSHELRTPLGAILGFAQLIETGTPPPTPVQRRSIEQILKAGWYLLELINEILDLALIESGKLSLSIEPIALAEVVHECLAMVAAQADQHGVSVSFENRDLPAIVQADRGRLKQILINFLTNAIKYNEVGGTVTVDLAAGTGDRLRISVRNSGAGMTPEQLGQLFDPFNRLGQEAHGEEGTGIGLVICKRLTECMAGIIGVDSTLGTGSTFWIELKQTTMAAPAVAAALQVPIAADGKAAWRTVLYVEDNPANLLLVEEIIAQRPDLHLHLLSATDGLRGLAMARAAQPDLILMDINLPGISGLEVLKLLAADPLTAHIRVLALSANAMPRAIELGLKAGFYRYLTKPIKVREFIDTVAAALTE